MSIKVYKFGGASVATSSLVDNLIDIIADCDKSLVVVISAIGKTTNALEEITKNFFKQDNEAVKNLFQELEKNHISYVNELFKDLDKTKVLEELNHFFTELEWIIDDKPTQIFDYYYDQIVSLGELLSTTIIANYMLAKGLKVKWLDIRDSLRTDNTFRDAKVDIEFSKAKVQKDFLPFLDNGNIVITQGYIGSTDQNENTTLGREGSDYTASLIGSFLNADDVSIWKDVKGLLNADPRLQKDAVLIPEIPYSEVIEMAYYGAQVIHPKTIKPLYNQRIPMYVKCFLDKTLPGTRIGTDKKDITYPAITVVKENQLMVRFTTRDFSFFEELNLSKVYNAFHVLNIKQNMTHISAISLRCVIDIKEDIKEKISAILSNEFEVEFLDGNSLHTVRHYTQKDLDYFYTLSDFKMVSRTKLTLRYVL